ncbi:MAG: hypothetical protein H7Y33_12045 [Cytophagales bacterium]|nr:hypothetical protein [Rhizobacter sp.]
MLLAAAVELGVPLALAIAAALRPAIRRWTVVVFGAITPFLLFFAVTTARHLVLGDQGAALALNAMWAMSLIPFAACVALGAALGFIRVPRSPFARYILGLLPPSLLAVILAITLPQ